MTGAIDLHPESNRLSRLTIGVNITDAAQAAAQTAPPSGATLKRRLQGRRIAMIAILLAAGAMNPLILTAVLSAGNSGAYAAHGRCTTSHRKGARRCSRCCRRARKSRLVRYEEMDVGPWLTRSGEAVDAAAARHGPPRRSVAAAMG
ncbi:hypothetical protein [Burkholderia anthina]|uniref:Uncharacterized protein n=1 Tax=Burkholderia anthina TaxID=179879 RepID=A0AAW3PQQ6_9BURK|nr:hypothetical protein WS64_22365 [Burkholderia anthina]